MYILVDVTDNRVSYLSDWEPVNTRGERSRWSYDLAKALVIDLDACYSFLNSVKLEDQARGGKLRRYSMEMLDASKRHPFILGENKFDSD